jgi:hybrid cluster-associated redox disulfide protein
MRNTITADQIVSEVLASWPKIVPLFIERRLYCVGCSMARFETLAEVSKFIVWIWTSSSTI